MATIIFHEKPGCPANAKQKQQLQAAGHSLEVRDLSTTAWTPDSLRPFFGDAPVAAWFNRRAAAVKDGAVDPSALDEVAALAAMIADPDLIRRPLMQVGDERAFGFDPNRINAWIGLTPVLDASCESRHAAGRCDHGHHHH